MAAHNELGKRGEELAADYLREKGYRILETNWRFGRNELDLIAREDQSLVIIEVKTRYSNVFVEPEMAVTREKQRAIIRSANAYVKFKRWKQETRFDIISIVMNETQQKITHIQDAFSPMVR